MRITYRSVLLAIIALSLAVAAVFLWLALQRPAPQEIIPLGDERQSSQLPELPPTGALARPA